MGLPPETECLVKIGEFCARRARRKVLGMFFRKENPNVSGPGHIGQKLERLAAGGWLVEGGGGLAPLRGGQPSKNAILEEDLLQTFLSQRNTFRKQHFCERKNGKHIFREIREIPEIQQK